MPRLLSLLAALATVAVSAAPLQQHASDIRDFRKLVGQTRRICGRVVTYDYPGKDGSGDCTLRLDIGGPYWNPLFYVLIKPDPGTVPSSESYLAQQVCANGKIESDGKNTPFIALKGADGVEVVDRTTMSPLDAAAVQACESGIVAPKLTKEVKPIYPDDEFRQRAQSRDRSPELVLLQAVVDETGQVSACRTVYSRSRSFSHAAEAALKEWRFTPAKRNGAHVKTIVQVEMRFTL